MKLFVWLVFIAIFFWCMSMKFGYMHEYFPNMGFWEFFWISDKIRIIPVAS
jgi:hypothetical protein